METTLHRQLKEVYAAAPERREVTMAGFRIDAVCGDQLVEIQSASLAAIRDKVRVLLKSHAVLVVKPLAASKVLIKRERKGGQVVSQRRSPRKETIHDMFVELVHFVNVFPHPGLTLHVLLTEQEEHRVSRKSRRWRSKDYRVEDRRLLSVGQCVEFRTPADLLTLIPSTVPDTFTTADLAREAEIPRWLAQRMAYCLRKTNAVQIVGKSGNTLQYQSTAAAIEAA
jgi:hypothetical protein